MSVDLPETKATCSLEDLINLNQEIVTLTRADFPLELGLGTFGSASSRRLKKTTHSISQKLDQGYSLTEAVESKDLQLPKMYGALVRSGLKTGRFSQTLEAFTDVGSQLVKLRREISISLIYPVIVFLVACLLLGFVSQRLVPDLVELLQSLQIKPTFSQRVAEQVAQLAPIWCPIICGIATGAILIWFRSDRSLSLSSDNPFQRMMFAILCMMVPWLYFLRRQLQRTIFTKLLALFVNQKIPLPEAFRLAGDASGSPALGDAARHVADRLDQGQSLHEFAQNEPKNGLPRLMTKLIALESDASTLGSTLNELAQSYHRQSAAMVEKSTRVYPVLLVAGFLVAVVAIYGWIVYIPIIELFTQLEIK